MFAQPERVRFKDEFKKAPRIVLLWFVMLVIFALVSIGMLLEGILHGQEPPAEGVRPSEAISGTLLFRTAGAVPSRSPGEGRC